MSAKYYEYLGVVCGVCLVCANPAQAVQAHAGRAALVEHNVKSPTTAKKPPEFRQTGTANAGPSGTARSMRHFPDRKVPILRWDQQTYGAVDNSPNRTSTPLPVPESRSSAGDPLTWRSNPTNKAVEFALSSNNPGNNRDAQGQNPEPDIASVTTRSGMSVLGSVRWKF